MSPPEEGRRPQGEHENPASTPSNIDWRENLGATIGLVATAYVAAKVLAVSHYSPETAHGFVRATGAVSAGVGAMLTAVPVLAGLLWAVSIMLQVRDIRRTEPVPVWRWFALTALTLFTAFVAPMIHMMACLVIGLLTLLVYQGTREQQHRPDTGGRISRELTARGLYLTLATVLVGGLLIPALFSPAPWLPPEKIETQGQKPFTAYVLAEEDKTVTLLYEDPRQIARIEQSLLQRRSICEFEKGALERVFGAPFWALRFRAPDYPRCPTDTAPSRR